jgi:hypothetical protein
MLIYVPLPSSWPGVSCETFFKIGPLFSDVIDEYLFEAVADSRAGATNVVCFRLPLLSCDDDLGVEDSVAAITEKSVRSFIRTGS